MAQKKGNLGNLNNDVNETVNYLNSEPRLGMPDGFAKDNDLADAYTQDPNEDLLLSGFPSFI